MFRTITIDPVLNGFSVMIRFPEGEQELVFNTLDALLQELRDYYTDPQGAEEHYRGTTNAQHIMGARVNQVQEQANPNDYYYASSAPTPPLRTYRMSETAPATPSSLTAGGNYATVSNDTIGFGGATIR